MAIWHPDPRTTIRFGLYPLYDLYPVPGLRFLLLSTFPSFTHRSVCQILIQKVSSSSSSSRIANSSLEVIVCGVLGFFSWFCCGCCRIVVHVVAVVFVGLEQPALFAIARFANHCCIFIYLHKIFGVWIGSFIN